MVDTAIAEKNVYDAARYLDRSFVPKGIGGWRALYLSLIEDLAPRTVMELGAGAPEFLDRIEAERRIAVDIGDRFAEVFRARGIQFVRRDLESDVLSDLGPVDVAVCSDVFEHLINPSAALRNIAGAISATGILFSHVPNEYRLSHLWRVMRGSAETVQFHRGAAEWNDPHFRRFSDVGFHRFLSGHFRFNVRLTDLRYGRLARMLKRLGSGVPYCLQGGPTYASCNSAEIHQRLLDLKKEKARG